MAALTAKRFESPDETREFGAGKLEILNTDAGTIGRAEFQPGWRWSQHVKPIAGTESCQAAHAGYQVSGRMIVRMDDGTEKELRAGDVHEIPPGHDAWVVGDEPVVIIDWTGMADYAKRN